MSASPKLDLWSEVQKNLDYMTSTREYLHQHPELSEQEHNTSKFVFEQLQNFGVEDVQMIAQTGVTGLIKGTLPGPVVLLRADMDALPIDECTDLTYKSQNPGVMHACGHDGHTSSLLGSVKILMENRHLLKGTIRLAFQPAEEGAGGANRMIEEGILDNPKVDYAFAFHVWGMIPEGKIGVRSGGLWASCDDITIELIGQGGHGSQPYKCINPILMGSEIIQKMNTYLAQSCKGTLGTVLSFGQFTSGSACNILPERAELKGSLRAYDNESRKTLLEKLEQCIQQTTDFYGGSYKLNAQFFAPPCQNDPELTTQMTSLLKEHCGEDFIEIMTEAAGGSEDFAFFSQKVPSFFFMLGIKKDDDIALHTPDFQWDSRVLQYSSWAMLNIAFYLTDFIKK